MPAIFMAEQAGDPSIVHRILANVVARTAIALDCETNHQTGIIPPAFETVVERLKTAGWAAAAYTSHSHTEDAPRYRIVLPLSHQIDPLVPSVEMIADLLQLGDVIDRGKLGPASLFYFPSCEPGSPVKHQAIVLDGPTLDADWIAKDAGKILRARENAQQDLRRAAMQAAEQRREKRVKAGIDPNASLIEGIRRHLDLDAELLAHGYQAKGKGRYLYPQSETGVPGVYLITGGDGIQRCYSHHSGDPLAAGNLPSWCRAKAVDAVDVATILDFGGDLKKALHTLATRFGIGSQQQAPAEPPPAIEDQGYYDSLDRDADAGRGSGTPPEPEPATPRPGRILTGAAFAASYVPPDWLVDGIVQRGRLYACTSPTGHGKTAIWLFNACMIHNGRLIGQLEVCKGNALILAGENPEDLKARMHGMIRAYGLSLDQMPYILPGNFPLTEDEADALRREIAGLDVPLALIVGDTASSFFPGDDENDNVQAGHYARTLRTFTECRGAPAVVVLSHPVKNAARGNLLPRGGGAFLNELDGNLVLWSEALGEMTELHWQAKVRGPDFAAVGYRLRLVPTGFTDQRARPVMTVVGEPMSEEAVADAAKQALARGDAVLVSIRDHPEWSYATIADKAGWQGEDGKPQRWLVQRAIRSLAEDKLIQRPRTGAPWKLTDKGEDALK